MEEKKLYVGFAKGVNNPPMGMHIPGHGGVPRPSCGILDDLYVYAVAFPTAKIKVSFSTVMPLVLLQAVPA